MPDCAQPRKYSQYFFPISLAVFLLLLVIYAPSAVFPLILSATLAYILNPLVNYFEVRGIKRSYVVTGLYVIAGIFFALLVVLISNLVSFDVETFKTDWPQYFIKLEKIITDFNAKLVKIIPALSNLNLSDKAISYLLKIPDYAVKFLPSLVLLFIVPFITFFILLTGSSIFDYVLDHIPSKYVELVLHITTRIDESLGNYLRGIITEAFIIFLISFFGLFLLQINYFSFIAIIIGLSSLVPYLGAIIGAALASLVAYFQYQNLFIVLKVLIFFAGIRFFDDWFLQPYIMKRAVNLNPAVIIFALMAGAEIYGFWGVVFAIPVTCVAKEILQISLELQESEFSWKPKPEPTRISIPYT
ncbi:MAG: AI-2E family transporter [Elusimicrobia bacterium]|nr:AI-2E family transporter [Elusimicrobiota bacterium]